MSFCSRVKIQISKDGPKNGCCMRAETYGLLLFSHLLTKEKHVFRTEQSCTAHLMAELTAACCSAYVEIEEVRTAEGKRKIFCVSLPETDQRELTLSSFGIEEEDAAAIDFGLIESECCRDAFLRGVFLACGTVSDPDKAYHVDFTVHSQRLCKELCKILRTCGINCGMSERRGGYCAYVKEGESIEQLLAVIGAGDGYYEFVKLRLHRNLMNTTNRQVNCDNANISKIISAAQQQLVVIRRIEKECGLEKLPEDLRELAELRLENHDMSLRDLGECLSVPLSRSGVNHRMQRIIDFAAHLDGKE